MAPRPRALEQPAVVTGIYALTAIVMTWPLARGLARDVAWDLGDSLFNMWVLAWDCTQFIAMLRGAVPLRIDTLFNANIFFPEPRTLAYSEHLIPQALQILPVYALTGNPILSYNLLFLSTFVLCGLGTYLLVRELTGDARSAFVAGLFFAFAPYRVAQSGHLQVISAQWMPLTLYGFRRFFITGRVRALVGGTASYVLQCLSCGYYLLFFTPFVMAYVAWEVTVRGAWRQWRTLLMLGAAAVVAALLVLPFLLPYLAVRESTGGRGPVEIAQFSADVYSYFTSSPHLRVWGNLAETFPRAEGEVFTGVLPMLLAAAALGLWLLNGVAAQEVADTTAAPASRVRWLAGLCVAVSLLSFASVLALFYQRRIVLNTWVGTIRAADLNRPLIAGIATLVVAAIASARVREVLRRLATAPEAYLAFMLAGSWWLSLGPQPTVFGRPLDVFAPYRWLLEHVPGFDGARVPARFAMIVALALASLSGFAVRALGRRWGTGVVALVACAFLIEANAVPYVVNGMTPARDVNTPEGRVFPPARAPEIYKAVARLPSDAVLIEFPLGSVDYDVRAVYYSTTHWRRLVNGYSGFFPPEYVHNVALLTDIPRHPDRSLSQLRATGATHAVVHEAAFLGGDGLRISEWLRQTGAVETFRSGTDVLFALRHAG